MSLNPSTNQLEHDKFVANSSGEAAVRVVIDPNQVSGPVAIPSEFPLPDSQVITLTPPAAITGYATSDKQLGDNHQVTVSNQPSEFPLPSDQITTLTPPAAITGFATSANQTDGSQQAKIKETVPTDATKVNGSLVISNTDSVQASTKTLTKTIGATSYVKTLSLNAGGDVIAVSAWSEV